MPTLLETFRILTAFSPPRANLRKAPWEQFVEWSIAQGVAPIAAYNLEYRMPGSGAPDWARERLMSVYQGVSNDNVMKLVNFKRAIDELEGRRVLAVGGLAYAEGLYPHIAFRPVPDLELWVPAGDVDALANFLAHAEFKPEAQPGVPAGARLLSDGRTQILIRGAALGPKRQALLDEVFARALPMKPFGASLFRPDLEDAILIACLLLAQAGFESAAIEQIDLRELVSGAPSVNGPYTRPLDAAALRERASRWRIDRAVWAALSITARLFPETAPLVAPALPVVRPATQRLLERWIVGPSAELGGLRLTRGADRLKRLLAGG